MTHWFSSSRAKLEKARCQQCQSGCDRTQPRPLLRHAPSSRISVRISGSCSPPPRTILRTTPSRWVRSSLHIASLPRSAQVQTRASSAFESAAPEPAAGAPLLLLAPPPPECSPPRAQSAAAVRMDAATRVRLRASAAARCCSAASACALYFLDEKSPPNCLRSRCFFWAACDGGLTGLCERSAIMTTVSLYRAPRDTAGNAATHGGCNGATAHAPRPASSSARMRSPRSAAQASRRAADASVRRLLGRETGTPASGCAGADIINGAGQAAALDNPAHMSTRSRCGKISQRHLSHSALLRPLRGHHHESIGRKSLLCAARLPEPLPAFGVRVVVRKGLLAECRHALVVSSL